LLTCRSRKYLVSWLLCGWHWLPSQCRLANQTPSSIEITVESLSFLKIKGCMICCIWSTDCWHLVESNPNFKGYPTVSSSWNHISKLDAQDNNQLETLHSELLLLTTKICVAPGQFSKDLLQEDEHQQGWCHPI
jgi:hypothetical protein